MKGHLIPALAAAAALLGAAGCSIPLAEADAYSANICSSDSECAGGSSCVNVDGNSLCVAGTLDLPPIVFEVRPVSKDGTATPSLIGPLSLSSQPGSQLMHLDLPVPPYVDVSPGRVFLPCGGDTPVPAKVKLFPLPVFSGLLEKQSYEADSMLDSTGNGAFHLSVPPGNYDLYIQPQPDAAMQDCAGSPPIFIPEQPLSRDGGWNIHALGPIQVTGTLKLSQKEDFTKWFLEVVEPRGGQPISEVVQPQQDGIALEVPISIKFDWTAFNKFNPLIRLRPPEGSGKPVVHWSLPAVATGSLKDGMIPVKLDVSGIDTQPRAVAGQVLHDNQSVAATVTLHSLSISGQELTRYETILETDSFGRFEASVPRGVYEVIARPHSDAFAVGTTTWKVLEGDDCFCGNAVEVPSATTVAGSVTTPGGEPAAVDVSLTPVATPDLAYLGSIIAADIPPRPASAFTDNGQFKLSVDAGLFDLSLVSATTSGYPWLVRPRQPVTSTDAGGAPVVSLEPLQLQTPAVVRGVVSGPDGAALPGATVRAWIGVPDPKDATARPSAVQIAQAIAGDDGSYVLLLPPSIKVGK